MNQMKINLKELCFYIALLLWTLQEYIMKSDMLSYLGYVPCQLSRAIAIMLLICKSVIFDSKYSRKSLGFIGIVGVIAILGNYTSNFESANTIIVVFLFVLGARNIDFTDICSFEAKVSAILFAAIVIGAQFGAFNNGYIIEGQKYRYYLGFDYVSFPSIYFMNIVCCAFYAMVEKRKKISWALVAIFTAITIWIYEKTVTRLAAGITLIFIVLCFIFYKKGSKPLLNNRFTNSIAFMLYPIFGVLTYITSIAFNRADPRWLVANSFMSNRLLMNNIALQNYSVKFLGQVIKSQTNYLTSEDYFFIDSGYMSLLLRNGLLVFITVILLYSFMTRKALQNNNIILFMWLVCLSVYSIFNGIFLSPITNTSIFAIWFLFDSHYKTKRSYKSNG